MKSKNHTDYLVKENCRKYTDTVVNRAWIIYFVIGVLMLVLGIVFLSEWICTLFLVVAVCFLIIAVLFEPLKYEFDDNGIKFKGVIWRLGYIKYENIRTILMHYEWIADSAASFEYYELYGPCEEKFRTTCGLRIIKTKKTTALLKQHCPLKFSKLEEEKKPIHGKKKPHQKRK